MTFDQALDYLGSLEALGIRPGLDRIRALLARLGDPHEAFPSVLIGGTNGKGSISAYLVSILRESGVVAAAYTSPHLVRFEERVAVGGEPIGEEEVAALTVEVRRAIEAGGAAGEESPTYFEATTALAFLHFKRRRVPIAVLEVGMGGRFDATNVKAPLACAISTISLDHMQWLGATLEEIASQKAGILKPGVPAVLSRQDPGALEVIRTEAAHVGARLVLAADCTVVPAGGARFPDPPVFTLITPSGRRYDDLTLALRGSHQVANATTAVLLAEQLAARGFPSIDVRAIARGLARAVWPGRIEIVPGARATGGGPDLLLDGAHNPAGCEALAAYLRDYHSGRRACLIFAVMRDKPADRMLSILGPCADEVVVTSLPVARGAPPELLARLARERHRRVRVSPRIDDALRAARDAAGPGGLVVVSGSLYLVGEVKKILAG
jgi:dihydrofolate synthase/folylpolyglutamate synthase